MSVCRKITQKIFLMQPIETQTDLNIRMLLNACLEARKTAYAPYSKFHVGAAVLTTEGTIIKGCNVENACYGVGVCAEVVAISNAVSGGGKLIKAIAVAADAPDNEVTSPCGRCRQFIAEFVERMDAKVYMVRTPDNRYKESTLKELLPHAFTPRVLKEAQKTMP